MMWPKTQAFLKILNNQQKLAEAVTQTFSSSESLTNDLKKKIKKVEQELATIASTVKDMSVFFPLLGQKEKERKNLLTQLQFIEKSQKKETQACPVFVYTLHQSRQSLYKDLSIPLTSPFLSNSTNQNFQPLTAIHPNHNPLKSSGILLAITYPLQSKIVSQSQSQNKPSLDKYPLS